MLDTCSEGTSGDTGGRRWEVGGETRWKARKLHARDVLFTQQVRVTALGCRAEGVHQLGSSGGSAPRSRSPAGE